MTRRLVRKLVAEFGFSHAEFCVQQAESQKNVSAARVELNLIFNEMAAQTDPSLTNLEI